MSWLLLLLAGSDRDTYERKEKVGFSYIPLPLSSNSHHITVLHGTRAEASSVIGVELNQP